MKVICECINNRSRHWLWPLLHQQLVAPQNTLLKSLSKQVSSQWEMINKYDEKGDVIRTLATIKSE